MCVGESTCALLLLLLLGKNGHFPLDSCILHFLPPNYQLCMQIFFAAAAVWSAAAAADD